MTNPKNREFYQYKRFKVVFILLFIFIVAFYVFYNKTDLFKFPFESKVWGTASDWVMIIVTALTAVYLIRTFEEQKRGNEISENKDRREVMPTLKLEVNKTSSNLGYYYEQTSLKITVDKNAAYSIDIRKGSFINEPSAFNKEFLQIGESIYFEVNMDKLYEKMEEASAASIVVFFNDVDGRSYAQIIRYFNDDFKFDAPMLISKINSEGFIDSISRFYSDFKARFKKKEDPEF